MQLTVNPPVLPMLAKRVTELPPGDEWIFEPKWDGFRALVFRDHDEIFIQSRDGRPLGRYFPELIGPLRAQLPPRCVLDGEIVIARDGALDFESLQLRLHPAASRVNSLAATIPASIVCFDLLCEGERDLRNTPFAERRAALEAMLAGSSAPLHLTPATRDRTVAADWFRRFEGAGLDGVIAKPQGGGYVSNRRVMLKVKHERDCDCVVAGFRWHKGAEGAAVGSLLLGLFDDEGRLDHVGVCASFSDVLRRQLRQFLEPYRQNALDDHPWAEWARYDAQALAQRRPGMTSRWSQGKDLSWEPVRPELVAEVAYEHMQGSRFRHTARFRRWRPDKRPRDCTYAQLEVVPPHEVADVLATPR